MAEDFVSPGLVRRLLGRPSSLPSYSPRLEPQRLETSPREDYGDLALRAAQAGARGGALGGTSARAGVGAAQQYADAVDEIVSSRQGPLVFRGIDAGPRWGPGDKIKDPLSVSKGRWSGIHGNVAFGATNPATAATYADLPTREHAEAYREAQAFIDSESDRLKPGREALLYETQGLGKGFDYNMKHARNTRNNAVYPMRLQPTSVHEFTGGGLPENRMTSKTWQRFTTDLAPGEAALARGVIDDMHNNLYPQNHGIPRLVRRITPSDQYAWTEGVASMSGEPLTTVDDIDDVLRDAAARLGDPDPLKIPPAPSWGRDWRETHDLQASHAQRLFDEVARDPKFAPTPPTFREKVGGFLKRGGKGIVKGALSPVGIVTDALLGSGVGAGSAVLGYESARPRSAGVFTPQNPRYEGIVDPAMIEKLARQGEIENELERQRLIQQYNALGYDIDPDTRLRDLRR